jgi:hypothetical protein
MYTLSGEFSGVFTACVYSSPHLISLYYGFLEKIIFDIPAWHLRESGLETGLKSAFFRLCPGVECSAIPIVIIVSECIT